MIFLICLLIAVIAVIIYDMIWWKEVDCETVLKGMLWGLISLVVALGIWLGVACFNPEVDVVSSETCEISALADNARYSSCVSGSVFLVQSRVNETLKYSYMYEVDGKGFGFKEVTASQCYINYSTDSPHVRIDHYDYTNGFLRWLFPNIYTDEYIFYIPETAQVIDDFTIDFN
jgi:hypothetical protein